MPREVCGFTVFSANVVTYGRGLLAVPIALAMKYGALRWASFLVLWHDFLDHLDGVVASDAISARSACGKFEGRGGSSPGEAGAFVLQKIRIVALVNRPNLATQEVRRRFIVVARLVSSSALRLDRASPCLRWRSVPRFRSPRHPRTRIKWPALPRSPNKKHA